MFQLDLEFRWLGEKRLDVYNLVTFFKAFIHVEVNVWADS